MIEAQENEVTLDELDQDQEVGAYEDDDIMDDMDDDWREETLLEHAGRVARENPAATALVAVGLAWMALGGARTVARGANAASGVVGEAARTAAGTLSQAAKAVGDVVATGAESAQDAAERASKTVASTVRSGVGVAEKAAAKSAKAASRKASRAEDYVESTAQQTGSVLSQAGQEIVGSLRVGADAVRRGGVRARRATGDLAQNQPFLLSALCLVAGAGAAALLPRTQKESELLGGYKEEAVRAAKRGAVSLITGGVRTARAKTSEAVQEAARRAAEEAAERVLRQTDSIGDAVLDTLQKVTRDAGTDKDDSRTSDER